VNLLALPEEVVRGFFRCSACVGPIWHDIEACQTVRQDCVATSEATD
jgi:hypothetical protein